MNNNHIPTPMDVFIALEGREDPSSDENDDNSDEHESPAWSSEGEDQNDFSTVGQAQRRQDFDISMPATHSYFFAKDTVDVLNIEPLAEDQCHILPYRVIETVVVPGQTIPIRERERHAVTRMKETFEKTKFMVLMYEGSRHGTCEHLRPPFVSTIVQLSKLVDNAGHCYFDPSVLHMKFTGVYKCMVLDIRPDYQCGVVILDDFFLTPVLSSSLLSRYALTSPNQIAKLRQASILAQVPVRDRTRDNCEKLINYLKVWYNEDTMRNALSKSETIFSYWVAANVSISSKQKYQILQFRYTDHRLEELVKMTGAVTKLKCKSCSDIILSTDDLIPMTDDGFGNIYVNPSGVVHDLITATKIENFTLRGGKCSDYCWFPGYEWQIVQCYTCFAHLGWEYTSLILNPQVFYGITKSSVETVFEKSAEQKEQEEERYETEVVESC